MPTNRLFTDIARAKEIVLNKLKGQIRPEVLEQIMQKMDVPNAEARSIIEKGVSPWTLRTELPKDVNIDEIIALGKQNIKPYTDSRANPIELPIDDLFKYKEYDRFGSDRIKSPEELSSLQTSIEKEGIKTPLTLTVGTPKDPIKRSGENLDALLTEGNHRIAIAKKLGINKVPVQISGLAALGLLNLDKNINETKLPEKEDDLWKNTTSLLKR